MTNKVNMKQLEDLKQRSDEYKIISHEIRELYEGIERSEKWIEEVKRLGNGPFNFKDLEIVINDYKNLPLDHPDF